MLKFSYAGASITCYARLSTSIFSEVKNIQFHTFFSFSDSSNRKDSASKNNVGYNLSKSSWKSMPNLGDDDHSEDEEESSHVKSKEFHQTGSKYIRAIRGGFRSRGVENSEY